MALIHTLTHSPPAAHFIPANLWLSLCGLCGLRFPASPGKSVRPQLSEILKNIGLGNIAKTDKASAKAAHRLAQRWLSFRHRTRLLGQDLLNIMRQKPHSDQLDALFSSVEWVNPNDAEPHKMAVPSLIDRIGPPENNEPPAQPRDNL